MSAFSLRYRMSRHSQSRRSLAARQAVRGTRCGLLWGHGGMLFVCAEMDNHLWADALRGRPWGASTGRCEVSAEVVASGSRCLRQGLDSRLVAVALAGCMGIQLLSRGKPGRLYIIRRLPLGNECEYVEPLH